MLRALGPAWQLTPWEQLVFSNLITEDTGALDQASLQSLSLCSENQGPPESRKNQIRGACLQMHFLCCWSRLPWPQFPHLFNLFNPTPGLLWE